VAQLVAHLHGMEGVRGSSPLSSTEHQRGSTRILSLVARVFRAIILGGKPDPTGVATRAGTHGEQLDPRQWYVEVAQT
jgi:hypothetical protein